MKSLEIRFHGRGGQGAVVASRLLAEAAFIEGNFAQSFPAFGLERRGAPVAAFTRIQDSQIYNHSQIYKPDAVVVLDGALMKLVNVFDGLKEGGAALVNTNRDLADFPFPAGAKAAVVNAGKIALDHGLGTLSSPIVNTAILGALAALTGCVSLESIEKAIAATVAIRPQANIDACREAFDAVMAAGVANK